MGFKTSKFGVDIEVAVGSAKNPPNNRNTINDFPLCYWFKYDISHWGKLKFGILTLTNGINGCKSKIELLNYLNDIHKDSNR